MRLIRRQITPVIVGIGQGTLQSIGALQLGSAGFVEYPIVGARRGAGIIGGGQVGDIRSGIAPACRIGSAMQVSGKRFQAVFPPVGLWALAGVQRLPMEAAGCFTATAPRLLVGGADDQNRASCRDRPPHSAAAPRLADGQSRHNVARTGRRQRNRPRLSSAATASAVSYRPAGYPWR